MKTKRIASKKHLSHDWATIIAGLLLFFFMAIAFLSRPDLAKVHGSFIVSQGVLIPAAVMSAVFWALIELFTPPGKTFMQLVDRYIPALVIGLIVGGGLGYLFDFGKLVIVPAYNGNMDAVFFLAAAFIAGTAVMWDAVWEHNKGFLGQRGKGYKRLNFSESGKSKGRRLIVVSAILMILIFVAPFVGSEIGHAMVSSSDNSAVLGPESSIIYITSSNGTALPFANSNGTSTVSTQSLSTILTTDLTLGELNHYDVSKLVIKSSGSSYNLTIGYGNEKAFTPIQSFSVNSSNFSIPVSEEYLTANQSAFLELNVTAPVGTYSFSIQPFGDAGISTIFGPLSTLDFTFVLGGIIVLGSTFMGLGMVDIDVTRIHPGKIKGVRR
jgi:hypothetical protein